MKVFSIPVLVTLLVAACFASFQVVPPPPGVKYLGSVLRMDDDFLIVQGGSPASPIRPDTLSVFRRMPGPDVNYVHTDTYFSQNRSVQNYDPNMAFRNNTLVVSSESVDGALVIAVYNLSSNGNLSASQMIVFSDAVNEDCSLSVDYSDGHILAAGSGCNHGKGITKLYKRNAEGQFVQVSVFPLPQLPSLCYSGLAVAISGLTAMVSGFQCEGKLQSSSYVAVYDIQPSGQAILVDILYASSNISERQFGLSLALNGSMAVIGSGPQFQSGLLGQAEVYEKVDGSWTLRDVVSDPCSQPIISKFGFDVQIAGLEFAVSGTQPFVPCNTSAVRYSPSYPGSAKYVIVDTITTTTGYFGQFVALNSYDMAQVEVPNVYVQRI